MPQRLKERRKQLGVSLDELAAALGPGFSRARLSIAERDLIGLPESEHKAVLMAIERIGQLHVDIRDAVEKAQRVNLADLCRDIREQAQADAA